MSTVFLVNPNKRGNKEGSKPRRKAMKGKGKASHKPGGKSPAHNPAKPKRRRKTVTAKRTTRRHFKRNPVGGGLMDVLKSSLIGAAGALAVSALWGRIGAIPASLKEGPTGNLTRAALGLGAGMALKKVIGPRAALSLATGVVTVELAKLGADLAAKQGVSLGFNEPSSLIEGGGEFVQDEAGNVLWMDTSGALYQLQNPSGMGEVIPFSRNGLGEVINYGR